MPGRSLQKLGERTEICGTKPAAGYCVGPVEVQMGGIEFQDVFDPYYAGRKNPMPHEQAAKDKDANREEIEHQLADRAKRSKKLKSAATAAKRLKPQR
jgi:hypothetical protein